MGQTTSQPRRLRQRSKLFYGIDAPFVEAILRPQYLDWRKFPVSKSQLKTIKSRIRMPIEISENLFLSNATGVCDIDRLKDLGITHVLNMGGTVVSPRLPWTEYEEAGMTYKMIMARDNPVYPLLDLHLQEVLEFVKDVKATGGKCVIHCKRGRNRSGVLVAALYMLDTRTNVLETVLHCRKRRGNSFLRGNESFVRDLVALARQEDLLGPFPGDPESIVSEKLGQELIFQKRLLVCGDFNYVCVS